MPSPGHSRSQSERVPTGSTSYGQVIEYIQDRLYLASYTHPPNAHTPFPYPVKESRSPSKRSTKAQGGPTAAASPSKASPPVYFSIDRTLLYNAFYHDFGPLHIGHLYRFAVQLHEVLGDPANEERSVVFWCHADSRSRANAACILACYMVMIQAWPPHLALAPIAQMEPPCMPFRDAGYSQADFTLNIQDIVYGVWKAKEEGLVGLKDFSLEEYEKYERVDMGDFNWLTPNFLAFASPQHQPIAPIPTTSPLFAALPSSIAEVQKSKLPTPFKNVLSHFSARNIGLVVRLNSELYCPSYFTALGIQHLDMIFDDGTCPPLGLVRKFVNMAHEMIANNKGIAVHCKAGLGRTGCLIGAYLIYRHGFTANEVIAFMRFMRPGMVVGPQQHWLHLKQGVFREWWFEDSMKEKLRAMAPSTPTKHKQRLASNGQTFTPPNGGSKRSALGEITSNDQSSGGAIDVAEDNLPAPTPGQPRKTSKVYGPSSRHNSPMRRSENEPFVHPDTEVVTMSRHTQGDSESEEEFQLRMMRRNTSRSPMQSSSKRRAISCTTTMTTSTTYMTGGESDVENQGVNARPKTPGSTKSGSGASAITVGKQRSPIRRSTTDTKNGVRKTSGRVGSVGTLASSKSR
ncbi:tyrosine-protein phosphatase CDC14 [Pseudovirgaria hyperparasitica]|uniref:protein-tyrosine-phosphatase n=1 Tax=Pseudovirgaria hyperparasitica TaxID=470096 RepID=A0A6A6W8G1_9PEZI|nr:tyrosine-protein phosphatase CDC14 [Pseudovirgaria hyperparasitica]KAF2758314.1 tyrosine-protein phosphatase CDC14 [Pseudovirgaria hyperparasitica]